MFSTLRKMIAPIIGIVLLFFVGTIVFEWGMGFSGGEKMQEQTLAAVINGEEVPWTAYNNIYEGILKNEMQNSPDGDVSDDMRRQLHERAWQQLIHDRVLLQEAAKRDIRVSNDELYSYLKFNPPPELQAVPNFQTDGKFDYQKYMMAMADPQASPFWASIEPFIRTDIMKLKLQEMVIGTAALSEEEVKQAFLDGSEKVKVGVVNVSFDRFSRPPPQSTDDELRAYFEEHRDDYKLDERRGLNVALVEKEPKPYDWEVAYNQIKQITDSVKAGVDFAELAKRFSDDGSAKDGGDLGWFNEGQMVPEFDKMVFSMQPNTVSEPIKTQFGWHIIKLFDKKQEKEKANENAESKLVKKVHAAHILIKPELSPETTDELYKKIELFRTTAVKTGFLKAAEDLQMPVKAAQPFFRGKNIQYIGFNQQANDFAFDNKLHAISDLMENNSAYFIIEVSQILPAGPATFDESKEKVQMELLKTKVMNLCRDTANAIWADIQAGTDFEKAAKKHGDQYTVVDPFRRSDFTSEFKRDPQAIGAAFSLTKPGETKGPTEYSQGLVILKLIDRTVPDLTEYNSRRDSVYNSMLVTRQQELYSRWFENLVKSSKITNNVQKMLQENPNFL